MARKVDAPTVVDEPIVERVEVIDSNGDVVETRPLTDEDPAGIEPPPIPAGPVKVLIQFADEPPVTVLKPSAAYTQFVIGHGYKEIS